MDKANKKACIFHIPNKLDDKGLSGSQVRPRMMLQAFKNIGYDVDVVMGYGKERKEAIKKIKENIKKGKKYDFLYSESSTMPTLLTEKNHFPTYPFLDFSFFKFCKKYGIKIGLFYRDIHWKFPKYRKNVRGIKYLVAIIAYKYDLKKYEKLVDMFYLISFKVNDYIKNPILEEKTNLLLPAASYNYEFIKEKNIFYKQRLKRHDGNLNLFYVGGIGGSYQFLEFLSWIKNLKNIYLTICCRQKEWEEYKDIYKPYLTDNINIVHASGKELEKYYKKADISLAYFKGDNYMKMAVPVKFFEYVGHVCPIITTNNLIIGDYIKDSNIGWSIPYSEIAIKELLNNLSNNYEDVVKKHDSSMIYLKSNTWEERARKVANDLSR